MREIERLCERHRDCVRDGENVREIVRETEIV